MKNNKPLMRILTLLIGVLMLHLCAVSSFAAMSPSGIDGSKETSPKHLDDSHRETTVTLSLPSVGFQDVYDIVFVMDDSSSTTLASGTFVTRVTNLLEAILSAGAQVKVGVVKFKGLVYDAISLASSGSYSGLVNYGPTTSSAIFGGINLPKEDFSPASSGTNIHGGLRLADKWLSEDSAVADSHKYVVLLTDGKTYIWNDENDVATTIYSQGANNSFNLTVDQYALPSTGNQVANKTKISLTSNPDIVSSFTAFFGTFHPFVVGYSADSTAGVASEYQALFDYNADATLLMELSDVTGASPYDSRAFYAYQEEGGAAALSGTAAIYPVTNGLSGSGSANAAWNKHPVFTPTAGSLSANVRYLEFDPYEVIDNGDGTYSYDYSNPNPDFYLYHPDATQKATYLAGHLWADMGAKYNTAILGYASSYSGGRTNQQAFLKWMLQPTVSDFAAEVSDATGLDNLFTAIENNINYLIKSGKVTDVITDAFNLVQSGNDTFTVSVNGVSVTAAPAGTMKWTYGTETAGVYPYEVEYNESTKTIVWKINVPVDNSKPVSLSYVLAIDDGAVSGDYDTNVSAALEYTAFNDNTGTYTFDVPQADYTYDPITDFQLTKTYTVGTGYDNAGDPVTTAGTLAENVSFAIAPYKSFNRETGKTAIPAFSPASYTIPVGSGTDAVTVTLPDFSGADYGVGDYWYKITETPGSAAGVTYDATEYYLHVSVVHRGTSKTIGQVQIHMTAPATDGTFVNNAADKTTGLRNNYSAGTLTVRKAVTGSMADKSKTFDVNVTFTAPAGKTVTGAITYGMNSIAAGWTGSQTVTVHLTDGDSVTFENIPDGVTYTVAEADYSADGYDVPEYSFDNASETGDAAVNDPASWTNSKANGTVSDSADVVTVTNNKDAVVDVGVILENAPFAILFALSAFGVILLLRRRKRRA